jgi:predicted translin family RNA/ssDNA-binding protein
MTENEERYYEDRCKPLWVVVKELHRKERDILDASRSDPDNAANKLFELSNEMLNLASYYFIFNNLSLTILKNRSEDALNEARKAIYKAVIYLESIVTGKLNVPYSEYEYHVIELATAVDEPRRFNMVKKMGFAINLLEDTYGNNSKWKWSFVELEGRFAAVAKNMLVLSSIVANTDPLAPAYIPTMQHLDIVKHLLADVSAQYRDRYNLSTQRVEDLQSAQNFLDALRYIHSALGEPAEAENIKKQCEVIELKIENERKKSADAQTATP